MHPSNRVCTISGLYTLHWLATLQSIQFPLPAHFALFLAVKVRESARSKEGRFAARRATCSSSNSTCTCMRLGLGKAEHLSSVAGPDATNTVASDAYIVR